MKVILGKKLNMSQVFTADGEHLPVTVLEAGPCKVVQVKTEEKDKYSAVQIGFGKTRNLSRALKGHMKDEKFLHLSEFRVKPDEKIKIGDEITAANFEPGEFVDVIGVMKGRGYAGVMKRHGFHGFPASHGHDKPRQAGSIGTMFPQHVQPGTRMAGRMGGEQVTMKNLLVLDIDKEKNLIWVKGSVPGGRQGLVKIIATGKKMDKPYELHIVKQEEVKKVEKKEESTPTKISKVLAEKKEDASVKISDNKKVSKEIKEKKEESKEA